MEQIDLYCERLGSGVLAEPVNAATNAAFFVAAWLLWRQVRRSGQIGYDIRVLLGLIVTIGVGSALFHTFATTWARWLDVVPILLFQIAFLWTYARRIMRWQVVPAGALIVAFLVVALYARQFPDTLNGSLAYAPAIAALLALGVHQCLSSKGRRLLLLVAAAVFTLSISLRTLDAMACEHFAIGTHFFWHLLNAVVVYLSVRSVFFAQRA